MIEVIYWDLGGVCVDDNVAKAFQDFSLEYGEQQKEAWAKLKVGDSNTKTFFLESLKNTGLENKLEEIKQRAYDLIKIKEDGALPILKYLHSQGFRQGILSNHSNEWGDYILNDLGVANYVDKNLIIVSEAYKIAKPELAIFRVSHLLASLEPSKILFFDNKAVNVIAARKYGLNAELFIDRKKAIDTLKNYDIKIDCTKNL